MSETTTLRKMICSNEDDLQFVIFHEYEGYHSTELPDHLKSLIGRLLTSEEAAPLLDFEFFNGYGENAPGVIVLAWTEMMVYGSYSYDGLHQIRSLLRNPEL